MSSSATTLAPTCGFTPITSASHRASLTQTGRPLPDPPRDAPANGTTATPNRPPLHDRSTRFGRISSRAAPHGVHVDEEREVHQESESSPDQRSRGATGRFTPIRLPVSAPVSNTGSDTGTGTGSDTGSETVARLGVKQCSDGLTLDAGDEANPAPLA
jgi:hypothetical protein